MRRYGQKDTQLGAEMPYDEAVLVAGAYKQQLRKMGLTKDYGIRVERRQRGMAAIMLGMHSDRPMPLRWVS